MQSNPSIVMHPPYNNPQNPPPRAEPLPGLPRGVVAEPHREDQGEHRHNEEDEAELHARRQPLEAQVHRQGQDAPPR